MRRSRADFVLVALLVSACVSLLVVPLIRREADSAQSSDSRAFVNPLYPQLQAIGNREGIDVSFARLVIGRRRAPVVDHPLFSLPENSVDVLIFGDSVAAWGITPQVIERVSGLRVAMFAHPSMPLNVAQCRFYERVIQRYLAPAGRVLLMFAHTNLTEEPEHVDLPELIDASGEKFERAVAQVHNEGWWSYDGYRSWRTSELSTPLREWGVRLPSVALYRSWLEQYLNPAWHTYKLEREASHEFIRWDGWTAILQRPGRKPVSIRSSHEPIPLERWLPSSSRDRQNAEVNAEALKKLSGQKFMVLAWATKRGVYQKYRALYQSYFSAGAGLIDMGKLHPAGVAYPMADQLHTRNEAGFEASVFLGKWLRNSSIARGATRQ